MRTDHHSEHDISL